MGSLAGPTPSPSPSPPLLQASPAAAPGPRDSRSGGARSHAPNGPELCGPLLLLNSGSQPPRAGRGQAKCVGRQWRRQAEAGAGRVYCGQSRGPEWGDPGLGWGHLHCPPALPGPEGPWGAPAPGPRPKPSPGMAAGGAGGRWGRGGFWHCAGAAAAPGQMGWGVHRGTGGALSCARHGGCTQGARAGGGTGGAGRAWGAGGPGWPSQGGPRLLTVV